MKKIALTILSFVVTFVACFANSANFSFFRYKGKDLRFDKAIDRQTEYFNPILSGFYPDPSICRKGDTYYLVNSSFSFFPAVPIFESKDLVNWNQIGHVLDRESQVPLLGKGINRGIFAPAISYNEYNDTFYMITTNEGNGNFYVKSRDPHMGWSEPIYLPKVSGIDPSFFFDSDGKAYIVHNSGVSGKEEYPGQRAIRILQFDVKGDSIIGDPKEIIRGGSSVDSKPFWIEGPHLYRIGQYYYLMCAEGGTGDRHSEVMFRSDSPMGAWEECPYNPILTQRTGLDPHREDIVTSTGHADIIDTPDGNWWAVFLGCRPYKDDYYNTGRDTYLLPVTFRDGWPIILESGVPVPTIVKKDGLQPHTNLLTGNFEYTDHFNGASLDMRWMFARNPQRVFYTLGEKGLSIAPLPANLSQREPLSALFCRQQHTCFEAETEIDFLPTSENELAGLVLLQHEDYHFVFGKTLRDGQCTVVLKRTEKTEVVVGSETISSTAPLRLKICGDGGYYDFYYATGNDDWQILARGVDAFNLSTHSSGGFIGTCIGLYATTNE